MAKSKKPLKAALQSQQSRLKLKQKAVQAAQTAELMAKKQGGAKGKPHPANAKGKGKEVAPPRRLTMPFRATDKILLIGEGNFSFARALVRDAPAELEHLPARNVTATAYDTEAECYDKYPEAADIVQDLRAAGAEVHFGVDATQLGRTSSFKGRKWDRIVWNFPHAGLPSPISVSYFRLYNTDNLQAKALQTRTGIYSRTSCSFSGSSVLLLVSSEAGPSPKYFLRKSGNSRTTTMKRKNTRT
jgi:hypothetical protein